MIARVSSWSSASRARIFLALSNSGCQAASWAGVSRRVMVLPLILTLVVNSVGDLGSGGVALPL